MFEKIKYNDFKEILKEIPNDIQVLTGIHKRAYSILRILKKRNYDNSKHTDKDDITDILNNK